MAEEMRRTHAHVDVRAYGELIDLSQRVSRVCCVRCALYSAQYCGVGALGSKT